MRTPNSALVRYAIATVAVLLTFGMRVALHSVLEEASPRLLMTIAVLLAAWWGGWGPGIYATFLAGLLGNLLVSPDGRFTVDDPKNIILFLLFVFVGVTITTLTTSMKAAQHRAEEAAAAAQRNWESLLESDQRAHALAQRAVEWRNRFDALAEAPVQAVYVWDPRFDELRFNEGVDSLLGYINEEMGHKYKHWLTLIHPEDRAAVEAQTARLLAHRDCTALEYRVRRKNGNYMPVEDRRFVLIDSKGEIDRVIGVVTDVSRRKRLADPKGVLPVATA